MDLSGFFIRISICYLHFMKKVSIIGGGNLGSAIAEGLLDSGFVKAKDLTMTKRDIKTLSRFSEKGVQITSNNKDAIIKADCVIIALKPYQVKEFLQENAVHFKADQIIISTITGVSLQEFRSSLGEKGILFRAMPNTAIAIKESLTCISYEKPKNEELDFVKDLFEKLGKIVFIDEKLMDAATVLGACGIAFAMRYIRANIQGGIQIGFDVETASLITAQTIKGAAQLLIERKAHPEQEIDKVTTPRGCTIAGLNQMEHEGFSSALIKGLITSYERIQEF